MVAETSSGNPYVEWEFMNGDKIRLFRCNVEEEELVWHRDKRKRTVLVEDGVGWKLQLDNELPVELIIGKKYTIPEMIYHRLIKGEDSNLLLRIKEA